MPVPRVPLRCHQFRLQLRSLVLLDSCLGLLAQLVLKLNWLLRPLRLHSFLFPNLPYSVPPVPQLLRSLVLVDSYLGLHLHLMQIACRGLKCAAAKG
jgi:hypothetical protein